MKEELKKTENGENNGSGSAEKTGKKKISSMEYIVIALSLLGVCLGALGMFGSSIARVLFPTNLGETKEIKNLYETKIIENDDHRNGGVYGTWCQKCCMMGAYQSTNPPLIHCCKCKSNHRGGCEESEQFHYIEGH